MNKFMQTQKKIEVTVVGGYKAIENGVVDGYRKIEDGVVGTYKQIEKKFVDAFLTTEEGVTETDRHQGAKEHDKCDEDITHDTER